MTESQSNRTAADDSDTSSSSSSIVQQDFTREDTEWQDIEEEEEGDGLQYVSLFDDKVFEDMGKMLDYCRDTAGIDIRNLVSKFGLDFYGCVKLVNYCREQTRDGNSRPNLSSAAVFADDKYLQPTLEDDAVLFSLDELVDHAEEDIDRSEDPSTSETNREDTIVTQLKQQLESLQRQFADYRSAVETTLDQRWSEGEASTTSAPTSSNAIAEGSRAPTSSISSADMRLRNRDDDTHYFDSYSYNDIHETMLKDTIRTSTYRDFIYTFKHLFATHTVLDIGTGTGILSLFSAKAGAAHVYAVDNSAIISKCRENVAANTLSDRITCVRGKIEDVALPGLHEGGRAAIDVIVSEWMGYCLLYESMLDSVLSARDRFLKPDTGIMAPSHCTLRIAPVSDQDYVADAIGFWDEVYGFNMRAMTEKIYDDVVVRSIGPENAVAESVVFKTLDLYAIAKEDLEFEKAPFEVTLDGDAEEGIDAWCIWFDTFFLSRREDVLEKNAKAEKWPAVGKEDRGVAFTTGPGGKETHWRAGLLVIDHRNKGKKVKAETQGDKSVLTKRPVPLRKGQKISGTVGYKKRESNSRELDIEISWDAEGTGERGCQVWCMR